MITVAAAGERSKSSQSAMLAEQRRHSVTMLEKRVHLLAGRERASVCFLAVRCERRPNAKEPDVDGKEGAFV